MIFRLAALFCVAPAGLAAPRALRFSPVLLITRYPSAAGGVTAACDVLSTPQMPSAQDG
jgi:hypothetical protein